MHSCLMGFVCVESFIVPESITPYVNWYHKPKRCFPSPSVSYKVLLEHHFQCFLPVQVTSCDWDPGGLPAALQQGLCTVTSQGHLPGKLWFVAGCRAGQTCYPPPGTLSKFSSKGQTTVFVNPHLFCEFPLKPFHGSCGNTQMCCMHERDWQSHSSVHLKG